MAYLLKARGLYTYKNELNLPEGSLDVADNIVIDEDDVIQSRRGNADYGDSFGTGNDRLNQILEYKDRILRHYNSILQFDDGSGTFTNFSGTYDELVDGLRLKYQEVNGNLYFTSNEGIQKLSASSASDITAGSITDAGGVKAVDLSASLVLATAGFLLPQSKVAYRIVWGTKDNNNNLILGSPSERFVLTNNNKDLEESEVSTIQVTGALTGSEYVLFSSTATDYFVWFNTGSDSEPETTDTLGRTAIEASVVAGAGQENANAASIGNAIADNTEFTVTVSTDTVTMTVATPGNTNDISSTATNISVTTSEQGNIVTGDFANAELTFTVPSAITTDYFYQIYRTGVTEVPTGLTINDIDPGDEMNLVLESAITPAEISAGEVVVEDITPEDFRAAGAFLYTNPITGEGILNANERPPLAQDIELFRNSAFYANTKTYHRLSISLLSTSGFTSGSSDLVIANEDVTSTYTFVGATEVYDITCDTFANTTADSVILISSARDEREYYIWFDKGGGTDPAVSGRTRIKVDISSATSAADISAILAPILEALDDFSAVDNTGSVRVTNAKNGNTTDASFGSPAPGGSWALANVTQGDGEDTSIGDILLSNQVSAALSIDETARSIVKVINRNSGSAVNAYYLSGADDLPGQILLENKDLSDKPFYIAVNDSAIVSKFNPEPSLLQTITAISIADPTEITSAGHGLSTGDSVFVYNTDSTPALYGKYDVTVTGASTFTVPVNVTSAGTTGFWFLADTISDNDVAPNRVYFSKSQQPEAVPLLNYVEMGARDKSIQRILALRDNLFVLKDDGIYLVTGSSAPNFGVRLLDGSTKVLAPDSAVVLNNQIFAFTDQGVATITETGVSIISRPIEDQMLRVLNSNMNFKYPSFGVSYESDRSYLLWVPTLTTDTVATQCFRYNTFTRSWTRFTNSATCGLVASSNDKLYLGDGTRNYLLRERKDNERSDFADRDISLTFPVSAIAGKSLTLSTAAEVEKGDVLLQTQYVTISFLKVMLRKLDFDAGLTDTDYLSVINPVAGDNLKLKLDTLNAKLLADDASGVVTSRTFSTDFATQQTELNALIAELNDPSCDTVFKDYKTSTGTVPYEAVVITSDLTTNVVTVNLESPWVEGPVSNYKGIVTKVRYSPQHMGDPAMLKQVREGTFIFDQRTFFNADISYASDQSPDFVTIEEEGAGTGQWGISGSVGFGDFVWGGASDDTPIRTLIPLEKQRCRYISVQFEHINAREMVRLLGISLEPRALSRRAYR